MGFSETGNQPTKCPAKLHRGQCPGIFRAPRRPQEAKEAGRAKGEWWVPEFTTNKTAENVKQLIG